MWWRRIRSFQEYHAAFRVHAGTQERRLPAVHLFLRLAGQLQLTVVLVNISVTTQQESSAQVVNNNNKNTGFSENSSTHRCSVLNSAKMCLLDMKLFSMSFSFRLSTGSMYFFSFSCMKSNKHQNADSTLWLYFY